MRKLFETDGSWVLFAQRVVLALVIFPHGAQKLLGWFGGYGFTASMQYLTATEHTPAPLAFLVILVESLGALALLVGFLARPVAFGLSAVMVGAVALVHGPHGFFMNWFGSQAGEGFEYHLLVLALSVPLLVKGAGAWAVDGLLARHRGGVRREAVAAA